MPAMAQRAAGEVAAIYADHLGVGPEYALVECIDCPATARIHESARKTTTQLVTEFAAMGWTIQPTRCPKHAEQEARPTREQLLETIARAEMRTWAADHHLTSDEGDLGDWEALNLPDYLAGAATALPIAVTAVLDRLAAALTPQPGDYDGEDVITRAIAAVAAIRAEWGHRDG